MEGDPCTEMTACIVCMILMTSRLLSCQIGLRRARDVTPPQTPGNKAPERRRFAAISRHQSKRPTFLNSLEGRGAWGGGCHNFLRFVRFLCSFLPLPSFFLPPSSSFPLPFPRPFPLKPPSFISLPLSLFPLFRCFPFAALLALVSGSSLSHVSPPFDRPDEWIQPF